MIRIKPLDSETRWVISKNIKKNKLISVHDRAQAVLMSEKGLGVSLIAELIGKNRQTVCRWLKSWQEYGLASLYSGHIGNLNASKLTKEQKAEIISVLRSQPSDFGLPKAFWDVPTLKHYLSQTFGVEYESDVSYFYFLKAANLSFKYPDKFDRKRDEKAIEARVPAIAKEIAPLLKDETWEVFCADEVSVHRETETRKAWLKKGERTVIKVDRKKEHRSYFGFLSQKSFRCDLFSMNRQDSDGVIEVFKQFLKLYPSKRIAVIWDNAPWHRSEKIKAELTSGGIMERVHLIPMPPYAPDENPIEHVWNIAKKNISNLQRETFDETKQAFESYVRNKTFEYLFGK